MPIVPKIPTDAMREAWREKVREAWDFLRTATPEDTADAAMDAMLAAAPKFAPSNADIEAVAIAMAGDLNRRAQWYDCLDTDETIWRGLDEQGRRGFCLNARAAWATVLARV